MPRDIASGIVLRNRLDGRGAHGLENAPGDDLTGVPFGASSQVSVNGESPANASRIAG
ncbi:hypothetical protein [Zarconia navalis]|uniref:hypothetical protein n=1 Tax=Zarconia navalis TaxID=2992134 RepID=UPI0021F827D0|nr:hypothetical protein [Zarconia navalis]